MPAGYAHLRFGSDILKAAPNALKQTIYRSKRLFDIGLYGSDPLLFYRPFLKNKVSALGSRVHKHTGKSFFAQAAAAARNALNVPAAAAYLYGFVCHYALDSCCHPYVAEKTADGVAHTEVETSFDRFLMLRDGVDPLKTNPYGAGAISWENAGVLAPFFPDLTQKQIYESAQSMARYGGVLLNCSKLPHAIRTMLGSSLSGLIITDRQNPRCKDSDARLWSLYQKAVGAGSQLLLELDGYLKGRCCLGSGFDRTFDAG